MLRGANARRLFGCCCVLAVIIISAHTSQASPPGNGWGLLFADEFNGTALDTIKWNYNYPWGPTYNHDAYMLPQNVSVSNGLLIETANRESYGEMQFTSGAINTNGKLNLTEGYIEGRFKMPSTVGAWPAFWMRQDGWPPEIDIFEVSNSAKYWVSYYYTSNEHVSWYSRSIETGEQLSEGFHNFAVEWTSSYIKFYFDDVSQQIFDNNSAAIAQAQDMHLLVDLAIGGWLGDPPPGSVFPTTFQSDWIRVWKKTSNYPASTAWTKAGSGAWDDSDSWLNGYSPQLSTQTATFGAVDAANVTVDWADSRTVGGLVFNSSVNYTLGSGDDKIMLTSAAPITNGQPNAHTVLIDGYNATGSSPNVINSQLELYNNVVIRSPNKPLLVNGQVAGLGALQIESGQITINGAAGYSGTTAVTGGALIFNGDVVLPGSATITGGSLHVNSLSASMQDIIGGGTLVVGNGSSAALLTVDSISVGALTIASGATVSIRPISGGPLSGIVQSAPEPSVWILLLSAAAGAWSIAHRRVGSSRTGHGN